MNHDYETTKTLLVEAHRVIGRVVTVEIIDDSDGEDKHISVKDGVGNEYELYPSQFLRQSPSLGGYKISPVPSWEIYTFAEYSGSFDDPPVTDLVHLGNLVAAEAVEFVALHPLTAVIRNVVDATLQAADRV